MEEVTTLQKEKYSAKDIGLSILHTLCYFLFGITIGITFILFFRPFFYTQIWYLNLPYWTNKTYAELKYCYDELMNCLMFFDKFSLGDVFIYSEGAKEHFLQCRGLFLANNIGCLLSFIGLIITQRMLSKKEFRLVKLKNFTLKSWNSFLLLLILIIALIWALIDFYSLFGLFHKIFFPGKDNYIFYPDVDPIINMFQEAFFINCAILIGVIVAIFMFYPLIKDLILIKKKHSKN